MSVEKLNFTTSKGKTISVPYACDALSRSDVRKITASLGDKWDQDTYDDECLKQALSAADYKAIDNLSVRDYRAFMAKWTKIEDPSMGES